MEHIENTKKWYTDRKVDILITILPAFFGLLGIIIENLDDKAFNTYSHILNIHLLQAVFILVTLFVLNRCRYRALDEISDRSPLYRFIRNLCNMRDEGTESLEKFCHVAETTIRQFFMAWLVIWGLWFAYYFGHFIFEYNVSVYAMSDCPADITPKRLSGFFMNLLDFLSSAVLFSVYLILNEVTVLRKERATPRKSFLDGVIILIMFAILFLAPSVFSLSAGAEAYREITVWVSLLLATISTVSFVLILGKLNSYYLQIPDVLLYGLYFYATAQAFEPLCVISEQYLQYGCCHMPDLKSITGIIREIFPWVTLLGKIFLMLTLIWITEERRFVFYVIHRSQSITDSVKMLKSFNKYFLK